MKPVTTGHSCGQCRSLFRPCWTVYDDSIRAYAEWCPRCGYNAWGPGKEMLLERMRKFVKRSRKCLLARLTETP